MSILTGILERHEMKHCYNAADLLFSPSYHELFPMTILEAMSCNKPLLLRDLPLYENILFDFMSGLERTKRLRRR